MPESTEARNEMIARALKNIDKVIAAGPYSASWESLVNFHVPQWYEDAKFGIFIHWGLYSVPAFFNEWYPRHMYIEGGQVFRHHVKTYGPQSKFGYKDFIPMFKAEKFDPDYWADLFKKAGARYVVPVAEHHDGFAMYDCSYHEWTAAKMGPKRDVVGDLARSVRKLGLVFGLSSHREEHWWFFDGGMKFDSDVRDPRYRSLYGPAQPESVPPDKEWLDEWLVYTCELVDKYRPQIVWFDWWINNPAYEPYLKKFGAYYYSRGAEWGKGVAINYKDKAFPEQAAVFDIERGQLSDIRPLLWQTDTSVSRNSWGYVKNQDYKTTGSIVSDLVDIVSKNGALLLNVCPKPDGTIPKEEEEMLLGIGGWLAINGEAIYGTRPWKVYGEGPTAVVAGGFQEGKYTFKPKDVRFTTKGNVLYAVPLVWPEGELTIQSLSTNLSLYTDEIGSVELLGSDEPVQWSRGKRGLKVVLPRRRPSEYAPVLKITKAKK